MLGKKLFFWTFAVALLLSLMALLSACTTSQTKPDPFLEIYRYSNLVPVSSSGTRIEEKKLSLSVSDMPFRDFVRWFSDETGQGVIYAEKLDSVKINAEFKAASPSEILSTLTRRYDFNAVFSGNTFYIGKLDKDDRGYLIYFIKGFLVDDLKGLFTAFVSEAGKFHVSSNGFLFVSDREQNLTRMLSAIKELERLRIETWIVQYFLVMEKKNKSLEYGGKTTTSGTLSYNLTRGEGFNTDWSNLGQQVELVLTGGSSLVTVSCSPMFLCRDGQESVWKDVTTVPIPQKTVSDSGTVTTSNFTFVDVGLTVKSLIRETSEGAILKTYFENSTIAGYVEYYPTVKKSCLDTSCSVRSGLVYLLGELSSRSNTDNLSNLTVMKNESDHSTMQVFCRLYKVAPVQPLNKPALSVYESKILHEKK